MMMIVMVTVMIVVVMSWGEGKRFGKVMGLLQKGWGKLQI
jgi:hypothetical protein